MSNKDKSDEHKPQSQKKEVRGKQKDNTKQTSKGSSKLKIREPLKAGSKTHDSKVSGNHGSSEMPDDDDVLILDPRKIKAEVNNAVPSKSWKKGEKDPKNAKPMMELITGNAGLPLKQNLAQDKTFKNALAAKVGDKSQHHRKENTSTRNNALQKEASGEIQIIEDDDPIVIAAKATKKLKSESTSQPSKAGPQLYGEDRMSKNKDLYARTSNLAAPRPNPASKHTASSNTTNETQSLPPHAQRSQDEHSYGKRVQR